MREANNKTVTYKHITSKSKSISCDTFSIFWNRITRLQKPDDAAYKVNNHSPTRLVAQSGRMKGAMRAEEPTFSLSSALLSKLGYPSQLCHYRLFIY
jgi:hypothetical protein